MKQKKIVHSVFTEEDFALLLYIMLAKLNPRFLLHSSFRQEFLLSSSFSKVYRFKTRYPELYEHVHPDCKTLFDNTWISSNQIVKWVCDKGPDHVWESTVEKRLRAYRHSKKFVCLYCIGKRVSVTNSLASKYPEIAKEWCYEKNNGVKPEEVTYGSSQMFWWKCPVHPEHIYEASPNDRTYSKKKCPYCNNSLLCSTNSLKALYPQLAQQWDLERNGELTPDKVLPSYSGKVWWRCSYDPSHSWECPVNYRVRFNWGCPFCNHRRFDETSLATLFPMMAKDWDFSKNDPSDSPQTISPNSEKVVWWKCEHGMEWKQSILSRKQSYLNGHHRCPICKMNLQKEIKNKQMYFTC